MNCTKKSLAIYLKHKVHLALYFSQNSGSAGICLFFPHSSKPSLYWSLSELLNFVVRGKSDLSSILAPSLQVSPFEMGLSASKACS